jgi:predicted Zn finger-like uncharacterized protein
MRVRCTGCSARYRIDDEHGGRWGRCAQCETRFMLPIPDAECLLDWAASVSWKKLLRFVNNNGARGHSRETIGKFIRIYERQRWAEESRIRFETASAQNRPVLSRREQIWAASERRLQRRRSLEELRNLDPYDFEKFVADLFNVQGYNANAIGGTADGGIDVLICKQDGSKWAIAQCKRYDAKNRVSASEIRDFGGAFLLNNVKNGFFFTTGTLTRHAKKTARGFPWLTTFNGPQLVDYIEKINSQIEKVQTSSDDSSNSACSH